MCIAIHKPYNAMMPSKDVLSNCFENNPNGAGYMFVDKDKVQIRKGFMNFEDMYTNLEKDNKKYKLNDKDVVLHFRITTSGGTKPELTHPYPVVEDYNEMRLLNTSSDIGLIHNGVMWATKGHTNLTNPELSYNDTMEFIHDYLVNVIDGDLDWHNNDRKTKLISNLLDTNKLVILQKDNMVIRFGEFIEGEDGVFYSNKSYIKREPVTYNRSTSLSTTTKYYNNYYGDYEDYTECCNLNEVGKLLSMFKNIEDMTPTEINNDTRDEIWDDIMDLYSIYNHEIISEWLAYVIKPYGISYSMRELSFNDWYITLGQYIDGDDRKVKGSILHNAFDKQIGSEVNYE